MGSKKNRDQLPPVDKTDSLPDDPRGPRFRKVHTDADRARWHAQYEALLEQSAPQEEADRVARELHERMGVQKSRRYRMVATLPESVASYVRPRGEHDRVDVELILAHIATVDIKRARELWNKFFEWAADDYRTYLAEKDDNMHTLDLRTFEAFKRIERERGEAARAKHAAEWEARKAQDEGHIPSTCGPGPTCDSGDGGADGLCVRCGKLDTTCYCD
jgi:hypothetical protein